MGSAINTKGGGKTDLTQGKMKEDNSSTHGGESEKHQHQVNLCSFRNLPKGKGERREKQTCSTKLELDII